MGVKQGRDLLQLLLGLICLRLTFLLQEELSDLVLLLLLVWFRFDDGSQRLLVFHCEFGVWEVAFNLGDFLVGCIADGKIVDLLDDVLLVFSDVVCGLFLFLFDLLWSLFLLLFIFFIFFTHLF